MVEGDDLTASIAREELAARETGGALLAGPGEIVAANVYLGAEGSRGRSTPAPTSW